MYEQMEWTDESAVLSLYLPHTDSHAPTCTHTHSPPTPTPTQPTDMEPADTEGDVGTHTQITHSNSEGQQ